MFEDIAEKYPPKVDTDLDALGDMVSSVAEGGLILQRALGENNTVAKQIMQLRQYIQLLFAK